MAPIPYLAIFGIIFEAIFDFAVTAFTPSISKVGKAMFFVFATKMRFKATYVSVLNYQDFAPN